MIHFLQIEYRLGPYMQIFLAIPCHEQRWLGYLLFHHLWKHFYFLRNRNFEKQKKNGK